MFAWNQLGINEFTNFFLYGSLTKPTDLTRDDLARPEDDNIPEDEKPTFIMSAVSFMADGPGRFVHGSECSVVADFMMRNIIPANGKRQEFSLQQAMSLTHKVKSDRMTLYHHSYSDKIDDHAFRTYLYESASFKVADDAIFVVEADGSRHIENYAMIPFDDNFDFKSSNPFSMLGNSYLEPRIDPSKMGRTVYIVFDEASKDDVPRKNYTQADCMIDVQNKIAEFSPISGTARLAYEIPPLVDKLWTDGVTQTIDNDGRVILYGSAEQDALMEKKLFSTSFDKSPLGDYYKRTTYGVALITGAGDDFLMGGLRDDFLAGGKGNDILEGSIGDDTYRYTSGDGQDRIFDWDGKGKILLDGTALGGALATDYQLVGNQSQWRVNGGAIVYTFNPSQKTLVINGTSFGANGKITVKDFDLAKAQSDQGYLGIKLNRKVELALVEGSNLNLFNNINFDPSSLNGSQTNVVEGTGKTFTVFLNQAAQAGQSLSLALSGQADKFKVVLGDVTVDANGAVIALAEGQTQVSFALVQQGDVSADASLELSASFVADGQSAISNAFGIALQDAGKTNKIMRGDQRGLIAGTEVVLNMTPDNPLYGTFDWFACKWLPDGTLDGGKPEANFADTFGSGAGNDKVSGLGGNDALDGGAGNDEIDGGDGSDLIAGGTGNDHILGGAGDDYIVSSGSLSVNIMRNKVTDHWVPPGNQEVLVSSPTWGIYKDVGSDGDVNTVWVGAETPTGNDADFVEAGDGNDCVITSGGDDRVLGGAGNDNLTGMAGNDVLEGGDGNDWISGDGLTKPGYLDSLPAAQHGADFLDGGSGDDYLIGGGQNDVLFGGVGNDSLVGDSTGKTDGTRYVDVAFHGNDFLNGEEGDDYLEGGGKDDVLYGGTGKDLLLGDTEAANVGDAANAVIWGNDYLDGGTDDDTLVGGGKDDTLYGGKGNDFLIGDERTAKLKGEFNGNDYLDGGDGNDILIGGGRDDVLYGGSGDDSLTGDDGLDAVSAEFQGNDYLDGGDGNDALMGGGGNDSLVGGQGDDVLDGGNGADYMDGGAGNDTYVVDDENDVVNEADDAASSSNGLRLAASKFVGPLQAATATAEPSVDSVQASVSYTLGYGLENLQLTGSAAINGTGNELDNQLIGNSAANILDGGDGNDYLEGGAGLDTLIGGTGDDVYQVDSTLDVVQEAAGAGNDTVLTSVSYSLPDQVERLQATGHTALSLSGNAQDGALVGNDGDNVISGGAGNDYVEGGAGNDTYLFQRGDGQDTLVNLDVTGAKDVLRFGPDISDTDVIGYQSGVNNDDLVLRVKGGTDQVTLRQYFAADSSEGGRTLHHQINQVEFANGVKWDQAMLQTVLARAANNHAPQVGTPISTLYAHATNTFTYTLPVNTLIDPDAGDAITYSIKMQDGSALPNWLSFDAANRRLQAVPSVEDMGEVQLRLVGTDYYGQGISIPVHLVVDGGDHVPVVLTSAQDQTTTLNSKFSYVVPDNTFTDPDTGDILTYSATLADGSALPTWLSFDPQSRRFSGKATAVGALDVRVTVMDTSSMTASDVFQLNVLPEHRVIGTSGDDTLLGGDGEDIMQGGAGNDVLQGGAQSDTYLFGRNQGSDYILDFPSLYQVGGDDTIVLDAGIKPSDVKLYRTSSITPGISNSNNIDDLVLVLNDSNQQIRIGDYFDPASDCAVENIVFQDGTVWHQADIAARLIDQSGQISAQSGSSGDDVFMVDHALDSISVGTEGGHDKVMSSVGFTMQDYSLHAIADDMELTGVLNINGTGNALPNTIKGNVGNNVLNGLAGNDVLIGGAGDDTYVVDSAINFSDIGRSDVTNDIVRDTIVEDDNGGIDTMRVGTYHATLAANVENMIVTGHSLSFSDGVDVQRNIAGNALNNVIDLSQAERGITRVDGGAGNDTMIGGNADETYVVDQAGDVVIERDYSSVTSVHDTIEASINYTLPANVEVLVLTGVGATSGVGNEGNNQLDGSKNAAINQLYGGLGDDVYLLGIGDVAHEDVGGGNDTVSIAGGREGNFSLVGYQNIENISIQDGCYGNLSGDAANNIVTGNRGDNVLEGGAGDDVLYDDGHEGWYDPNPYDHLRVNDNDQLLGGVGNDKLISYSGNDTLDGGAGNDELSGGVGDTSFVFGAGYGHDIILADSGDRRSQYSTDGDIVFLKADINPLDLQIVRSGTALQVQVRGSQDALDINNFFADAAGWTANDSIERLQFADGSYWDVAALIARAQGNNRSSGSADTDILSGGAGNDVLDGLGGNDVLRGDAGADRLLGSAGDDLLFGGDGQDTLIGGIGNDVLIGGDDADTYQFERGFGNDVVEEAGTPSTTEIDRIEFGSDILPSDVVVAHGEDGLWQTIILKLKGANGQFSDQIVLRASAPATINDYVPYDGGVEQVKFANGTVWTAADLIERAKTVEGTEAADNLVGDASNNIILGYGGNDTLDGGDGNDVLNGGAGVDRMFGGNGDDTYVVDDANDIVLENASQGTDTVQSSVTIGQLAANVENLQLIGSGAINGKGNALANSLIGNVADNLLDGAAGADTMTGGEGNDTYVIDNAGDVVVEQAAQGTDTVQSALTYSLGANVENLMLTGANAINGSGNDLANSLTGNTGSNVLDGGKGADKMSGGTGSDTYYVDNVADSVSEGLNAGTDSIFSTVSYTLPANVEKLTLSGVASINGVGNADVNTIQGNSADNVLDGGAGVDTMIGGTGNDTYVVDNASDMAKENAGEGVDTVNSSVSFTLADNIENITLTGSAAINAAGNTLANVLRGNAAANVLRGGKGDDTYYVSSGDSVNEAINEGNDTVFADVGFTLASNVENLVLAGSADLNGTGGAGNNSITGNAGNNVLDGGIGADKMAGGAGNDTYKVDDALDTVTENASAGTDLVQASVAYTLPDNVEALQLLNAAAINGTGNTLANLLQGNAAANTLNGAAGNDILQGGAGIDNLADTLGNNLLDGGVGDDILSAGGGNDFLAGGVGNDNVTTGAGADVIAFNRGDGMDVINASSGKDNTLSLGKGIKYADLLFKKSGNDLILTTGTNEQVNLKDWYAASTNHSIANLQIVIEGSSDYVAGSTNKLNNKKIEQFNFDGLVTKFDQARATNPTLSNWALSASLLDFYLAGSDTAALGGDLAYQYAKNGNLASLSMLPAQAIMGSTQFGSSNQNLQSSTSLQDSSVRLM